MGRVFSMVPTGTMTTVAKMNHGSWGLVNSGPASDRSLMLLLCVEHLEGNGRTTVLLPTHQAPGIYTIDSGNTSVLALSGEVRAEYRLTSLSFTNPTGSTNARIFLGIDATGEFLWSADAHDPMGSDLTIDVATGSVRSTPHRCFWTRSFKLQIHRGIGDEWKELAEFGDHGAKLSD